MHERGKGPAPLPIVLTHGFPSAFVEYFDLLPLLTDPAAHGGRAKDAFDVVIPSMPGYGFSDPLAEPLLETTVADLWSRLMRDGLGYDRFGAHGSDVGSGVTIELGLRHPEHLVGVHLSAFYLYPPPEPCPEPVQKFMAWAARRSAEDGAYSRMQSTKPQTVAFGLTASSPSISSTSTVGRRCRAAAISQRSRRLSSWRMNPRVLSPAALNAVRPRSGLVPQAWSVHVWRRARLRGGDR